MTSSHKDNLVGRSATVGTMDSKGRRRWLYPDRRGGPKASLRRKAAFALIILYLIVPWLSWNATPLIRLDVLEKKAYFFGLVFHLRDAAFVAPLLGIAALFLLFVTSIKGRLWCAYGCPQTVFVEWVIRPIEELTEGPAHRRRRLDSLPMTLVVMGRKLVKHALFLLVAAIVANTFLAFFFGPEKIMNFMMGSPTSHPGPFAAMATVMGLFYADLAWFREQFCAFVCPYARFQSVMIDNDTPTVAYDFNRGEPRGRDVVLKTGNVKSKGDCIDCELCVRVCPTGIDIREGLQLECIRCARCVDACDMIMTNIGRPKGLIRVATQSELAGVQPTPLWRRAKVLAFAVAMILLSVVLLVRIGARGSVSLNVARAPGPVYTQMPDGRFGNMLIIHINNNSYAPARLDFDSNFEEGVTLLCALCGTEVPSFGAISLSVIATFNPELVNKSLIIKHRQTQQSVSVPLLGPG